MKKIKWLLGIVMIGYIFTTHIYASSEMDQVITQQEKVIAYDDIQQTMDELLRESQVKIDFRDTLHKIIKGELAMDANELLEIFFKSIFNEVKVNFHLIIQLIAIALVAAIFTNFTNAFKQQYVGDVGYFVVFLLMSTIIMKSYQILSQVTVDVLNNLQNFIRTLMPSLFAAATLSGNYTSSLLYSQIMLVIISIVDNIIIRYVIPFVYIIIVLEIINSITEESILSKMVDLFKTIVSLSIKVLMIVFVGALTMQSFTTPVIDGIANKSVKVAVSAIPFVGATLSGVADTVLGCAVLIKNGIGLVALIVIIVICLIPIIKILIVTLLYKFAAAIIQPISDKRLVTCLSSVGDVCFILLGIVVITAFLFIIAITITLSATNVAAYMR